MQLDKRDKARKEAKQRAQTQLDTLIHRAKCELKRQQRELESSESEYEFNIEESDEDDSSFVVEDTLGDTLVLPATSDASDAGMSASSVSEGSSNDTHSGADSHDDTSDDLHESED